MENQNDISTGFKSWRNYWGELYRDNDQRFPSVIHGFHFPLEEKTPRGEDWKFFKVPDQGAVFGFVMGKGKWESKKKTS